MKRFLLWLSLLELLWAIPLIFGLLGIFGFLSTVWFYITFFSSLAIVSFPTWFISKKLEFYGSK